MKFYIDDDTAHEVAIVHREDCDWAQFREDRVRAGRWLGPYLTADLALVAAKRAGMPVIRVCQVCRP